MARIHDAPTDLADLLRTLRARGPIPLRPAKVRDRGLTKRIDALTPAGLGLKAGEFFDGIRSGLHTWNDDLDRAHAIAQDSATPTGSYWHGIMHRREGDYGNAKYWFRRLGRHAIFPDLLAAAQALAKDHAGDPYLEGLPRDAAWDPSAFVDACQRMGENPFLQSVQVAEIERLVGYCLEQGRC